MGLISTLKGVVNKMLGREEIVSKFKVTTGMSSNMFSALSRWDRLFTTSKSNIASVIASEAARLATIDMSITASGGVRAEYIQSILDTNKDRLRSKLELGCAYGGMVIKPNGRGMDFIPATRYVPIAYDSNGNMTSVIFVDRLTIGSLFYSRLEYHSFCKDDQGVSAYRIQNKAFRSQSKLTIGYEVGLDKVDLWSNLVADTYIYNVERPLFGYFRMPCANNVDIDSPLGVSIFSKADESIVDFDIIYDKWKREIRLSDKVLFIDEQAMIRPGATGRDKCIPANPFPELVKGLKFANGATKSVEEWVPDLRVDDFRKVMQTQLDLISMQCGFSTGYFSFDSKGGMVTATQVESQDQRTYSTCTDIQQNYKQAIEGYLYAEDVFLSLYTDLPEEELNISFYTRDLYVNVSEDRKRAFDLSSTGFIPKWKYLVDYEGYSEEDAKLMVKEAEEEASKETS